VGQRKPFLEGHSQPAEKYEGLWEQKTGESYQISAGRMSSWARTGGEGRKSVPAEGIAGIVAWSCKVLGANGELKGSVWGPSGGHETSLR